MGEYSFKKKKLDELAIAAFLLFGKVCDLNSFCSNNRSAYFVSRSIMEGYMLAQGTFDNRRI